MIKLSKFRITTISFISLSCLALFSFAAFGATKDANQAACEAVFADNLSSLEAAIDAGASMSTVCSYRSGVYLKETSLFYIALDVAKKSGVSDCLNYLVNVEGGIDPKFENLYLHKRPSNTYQYEFSNFNRAVVAAKEKNNAGNHLLGNQALGDVYKFLIDHRYEGGEKERILSHLFGLLFDAPTKVLQRRLLKTILEWDFSKDSYKDAKSESLSSLVKSTKNIKRNSIHSFEQVVASLLRNGADPLNVLSLEGSSKRVSLLTYWYSYFPLDLYKGDEGAHYFEKLAAFGGDINEIFIMRESVDGNPLYNCPRTKSAYEWCIDKFLDHGGKFDKQQLSLEPNYSYVLLTTLLSPKDMDLGSISIRQLDLLKKSVAAGASVNEYRFERVQGRLYNENIFGDLFTGILTGSSPRFAGALALLRNYPELLNFDEEDSITIRGIGSAKSRTTTPYCFLKEHDVENPNLFRRVVPDAGARKAAVEIFNLLKDLGADPNKCLH